jgi:hypothetical protein
VLGYIKATVFGGDPKMLSPVALVSRFARLTWQDRCLEITRYLGGTLIFIGLLLINLVRDSDLVDTNYVCTFRLSYWVATCVLFGLALFPIFVASIVQFFTLVPPLSPYAAAVSLEGLFQSLGTTGSTVSDEEYLHHAAHCSCYWVARQSEGKRYPVLIRVDACRCELPVFDPQPLATIFYYKNQLHWLYMLIAAGAAASIIGAYILCKQESGGIYFWSTSGQLWSLAAILVVTHLVTHIIKDIARDRFMCCWVHDGLSAGYICASTRIWGSGAEWVWTALLHKNHRRFGMYAFMAYMSVVWVVLAALWMAFDGLFNAAQQSFDMVYGTLFIGFIFSCAGFYYLKRDFNHPVCVLKPQPLLVLRWIVYDIHVEIPYVPETKLGTIEGRVSAGISPGCLGEGTYF